jgi:hypothetical protein
LETGDYEFRRDLRRVRHLHPARRADVSLPRKLPRHDVSGAPKALRVVGIATGDQAIFVRRIDFERIGGFPDIPLMEDIALSRALRRLGPPACITMPVITSARRWQRHGVLRTILLMWRLRFAYSRGADPADLAMSYGYAPHDE